MKQCKSERNDFSSKNTDKINSDDLDSKAHNIHFDDTYNGNKNVNYPYWNKGKSINILKNKLARPVFKTSNRLDIHEE